MVASVHELASRAGIEMMQAGGNAVDAAVATGFALAVVHPQAGNLGGGGFMLIRMADGKTHVVDYREKAPAAATANMYLDVRGNVIADASIVGYKAIAVPGSVAGLVYALKKYGKLPLERTMAPAIKLARDGYPLAWEDAEDFRKDGHLAQFPESRHIFQRDGNYYQAGEIFRQPQLARILERIASNPDDFYHGAMARELAAAIQKGGGLVTAADLADYEVKEREPVRGTYRGYEIISAPPPSSGGIALIEIFNILEGYDLAAYGSQSAQAMHLALEAFRRAFFDRAEFLGDPDFSKIPVAQLIDKRYGAAWRESIDPANAIGPGRRPLSAMTPTMVLKDGRLFLVLGSPGGPRIITTVANILMGVVEYGMNIQEAVNAPRFHHQWLPDVVRLEEWSSPDSAKLLEQMGHKVEFKPYWSDGECIAVDLKTGERLGASDGRNNGKAGGF